MLNMNHSFHAIEAVESAIGRARNLELFLASSNKNVVRHLTTFLSGILPAEVVRMTFSASGVSTLRTCKSR